MARISELHYSNALAARTGIAEFLEVALSPGEDPADFTVGFYQANGSPGLAVALTDPGVIVTFDPDTNETTYVISADNFPLALTDPDGGGGTQNITATGGVAQGATSTNLPVPNGPNAATYTLQFNQPNPGTLVYESPGPGDTGLVCFVAGTRIDTATGPRPVETLRPGDLVWTLDHGPQPLTWVGQRRVAATGRFAPIRIAPGVFGNDTALLVSPQHRILIRGWQAELPFGEPVLLVAACHLVSGDTIARVPQPQAVYCHIMFDRHQIIRSNGALTESFYPGPQALSAIDRDEVLALFPELSLSPATFGPLARPGPTGREARCLEVS